MVCNEIVSEIRGQQHEAAVVGMSYKISFK